MRRQVVLGAVTGALWLAAELLRGPHVAIATLLSMGAWMAFLLQLLAWARGVTPWGAFTARAARVSALTLVSLAVLLLYYVHSRIEETGIHVDAVYTYVGLQWFLELHNPITFAGATYSYHQFPLALLSHLPGVLLGFDRLGPFALNLGVMLTVALLLAIMTVRFAPSGMGVQLLVVALASAVFSNRLLVQSYHIVGYTIPAVCLGLMLLVVADDESFPRPERMAGGLLALAVLHHLPGVMLVLPVVVAWLILRRHPISEVMSFLAANPPLLTIAGLFVITLWVHPALIVRRVEDLTVGPAGSTVPPLATRMRDNWGYLTATYPLLWMRSFVLDTRRSWYLVDLPPLGGLALPILAATWLCSAVAVPGRAVRYLLHLGALAALLLALSGFQHVLTDFSDYRDLTMIFALTVAGFLFVFRASRLEGTRKRLAWGLAVAIALYNYADVTQLRGRTHLSYDYAPHSQAVLERVRSLSRQLGRQPFGAARVYVVLDQFVSTERLYLEAFRRRGLPVSVVRTSTYCPNKVAAIVQAAAEDCEAFLWFEDAESCEFPPWQPSVRGMLFTSACNGPERSGQRTLRQVVP
jgi:hypothetical protein